MLNSMCGTTNFDLFNVEEIPDVIIGQLSAIYEMRASLAHLETAD